MHKSVHDVVASFVDCKPNQQKTQTSLRPSRLSGSNCFSAFSLQPLFSMCYNGLILWWTPFAFIEKWSFRRRWLIACPTSGRQATILSILLILSKNLRVWFNLFISCFTLFDVRSSTFDVRLFTPYALRLTTYVLSKSGFFNSKPKTQHSKQFYGFCAFAPCSMLFDVRCPAFHASRSHALRLTAFTLSVLCVLAVQFLCCFSFLFHAFRCTIFGLSIFDIQLFHFVPLCLWPFAPCFCVPVHALHERPQVVPELEWNSDERRYKKDGE